MTTLIVDLSSVVHACRWGSTKDAEFSVPLIIHSTIDTILNHALLFDCDSIFIACDSRNYWRRDIYPEYKAGRKKDDRWEEVNEVFDEVKDYFTNYTKVPVCEVLRVEADDIIARAVKRFDRSVILSTDKDFIQLISENVRLYSPTKNTGERTCADPKYELFVKLIRGDSGDNITSAYPRVRSTKLKEAYSDPVKMMELMEHTNKDGSVVKDVFKRNKQLIDLNAIPEEIARVIDEAIEACLSERKTVGMFAPLKFYHKHELKNLTDEFNKHRKLLV